MLGGGAEGLGSFLESLPSGLSGLLKAFGIEQPTAENYIAAAYQDPRFLIILHAFAIGTASAALAGEIERGTALYLLSRPISRVSIVLSKMAASALAIAVLIAAAFLGTMAGAAINGFLGEINISEFLRVLVMAFVVIWLASAVSFLLSARSNDRGHVLSVAAGIFVTLYFLEFVAGIWPAAEVLGPLSPFHYYDPVAIVRDGGFPWRNFAFLSSLALTASALAAVVFERRDIR